MKSSEIDELVTQLKKNNPGWHISFGYIGNVERWGDDRSWHFSMRPEAIMCVWESQDIYNIPQPVENEFEFDLENFIAWMERQKIKYVEWMKKYVNQLKGNTELEVLTNMFDHNGIHWQDMFGYSQKHIRARIYKHNDSFSDIGFDFDSLGNCIQIYKDNC